MKTILLGNPEPHFRSLRAKEFPHVVRMSRWGGDVYTYYSRGFTHHNATGFDWQHWPLGPQAFPQGKYKSFK